MGPIKIVLPFSRSLFKIQFPFVVSQGADVTDPGTETEESLGASDSTQRPADSQTSSCKIQEALSRRTYVDPPQCFHIHSPSHSPLTYLTLFND